MLLLSLEERSNVSGTPHIFHLKQIRPKAEPLPKVQVGERFGEGFVRPPLRGGQRGVIYVCCANVS